MASTGFADNGSAETVPPGPALADLAGNTWDDGLARLTDDELVGMICSWRRLASWSSAGEAAAIAELAERRYTEGERSSDRDHLADEIGVALTLTPRGAERLLSIAAGLARLPVTHAALTGGLIDWARAVVVVDELAGLDVDDAAAAESRVLPRAGELTTGQLRAALRRAVAGLDPDAARRRREKAQQDARVETWQENSGTAALAGRDLPPAEVIAADKRIDGLARWLKQHRVDGTLEQLRAQVYTALLLGRPIYTLLPEPRPGEQSPGGEASVAQPDRDPAQPGRDPGQPDGELGWPSAGWAQPAAGSAWPPGLSGWVNLTLPLASYLGWSESPGDVAGTGPLDAAACRDLACAIATTPGSRWCLTLTDRGGRAIAHGCARAGPDPPGRDDAEWLARIKISPLAAGACAHEHETPAYRPSAKLSHRVKVRQRTCSFPTCRRPAVRCDDDHTIPHDRGGRTCECNLAPLCRRHHRAKQAPGWHLDQPEPGVLIWTLPSGRTYASRPDAYPG